MLAELILRLVGLAGEILAVEGILGIQRSLNPDDRSVHAMGE